MSTATLYRTSFRQLAPTDTVAEAAVLMLKGQATDLPVVDAAGKLLGMFKLQRLYANLLPKAVLIGTGVPDLRFMSDSIDEVRERMAEIAHLPVKAFMVKPDLTAAPDASPFELVHLLYRGANNIPVVDPATGRLVGVVATHDVLAALVPS